MAFLIESADVSAFTDAYTPANGGANDILFFGDTSSQGKIPNESGTGATLNLYVSTAFDTEFLIFEDNILVMTVPVLASLGAGYISMPLPSALAIDDTKLYRGVYNIKTLQAGVSWFARAGDSLWTLSVPAGTVPDPLVDDGSFQSGNNAFYWSIESGSPFSVTAPATINVGDTAAISTAGLGTLTTATVTDPNGNVLDVFNSSDTSIATPNFNTAGQAACLLGDVTLTVGDGTDTATTTTTLEPATGFASIPLSGLTVPAIDNNYVNSGAWTEEPEDGDHCYYPNDTVTVAADGLIDSSGIGTGSYTFLYYIIDQNTGVLAERTNIFSAEVAGDPSLTLPWPLGSTSGVAAAENNVPVSVCRASDMVQVYSGVVSWGSDGVVPSIVDAAFVFGEDYSIAIEGNFMAKFTVTAV